MNKKNRPTLKKIAQKLGLSTAAVSKALENKKDISDKTKKAVLDEVKKQGYVANQAAKALQSGSMKTIGVIFGILGSSSNDIKSSGQFKVN